MMTIKAIIKNNQNMRKNNRIYSEEAWAHNQSVKQIRTFLSKNKKKAIERK
jgi:hypothetical protein